MEKTSKFSINAKVTTLYFLYMSVPQRVKAFLKEKKLTQSDFCKITGYSISNFSNFLIGKTTNPRIDLIYAFTTHFPELSINWLFNGRGSMYLGQADMKEEPVEEPIDLEKKELKEELLSVYKDKTKLLEKEVGMLERELKIIKNVVKAEAPAVAGKLEIE